MDPRDSERMDADPDRSTSSDGATPLPQHESYYEQRRTRFVAAVKGFLPLSEYVKEVAADVDRRFPPIPQA